MPQSPAAPPASAESGWTEKGRVHPLPASRCAARAVAGCPARRIFRSRVPRLPRGSPDARLLVKLYAAPALWRVPDKSPRLAANVSPANATPPAPKEGGIREADPAGGARRPRPEGSRARRRIARRLHHRRGRSPFCSSRRSASRRRASAGDGVGPQPTFGPACSASSRSVGRG
jgi:hypothetical protein